MSVSLKKPGEKVYSNKFGLCKIISKKQFELRQTWGVTVREGNYIIVGEGSEGSPHYAYYNRVDPVDEAERKAYEDLSQSFEDWRNERDI